MSDWVLILPATSAILYALASLFTKQAILRGGGLLRSAFITNQLIFLLFCIPLLFSDLSMNLSAWPWLVVGGVGFSLGQAFTYIAIRVGDVSIQTPVMGTKAVFVMVFSVMLGTSEITGQLWLSALASAFAVFLLGFAPRNLRRETYWTICLSIISAAFFAIADIAVGAGAPVFGRAPFMAGIMGINALASFAFVPFFRRGLGEIPKESWPSLAAGCGFMGIQAFILGMFFSSFGRVPEGNIVYSSRGLWSVVLAVVLARFLTVGTEKLSPLFAVLRFIGALLMSAAIVLALS